MGVSKSSGTPKSSIYFNRVFGFFLINPSILGYPYFWKHAYYRGEMDHLLSTSGDFPGGGDIFVAPRQAVFLNYYSSSWVTRNSKVVSAHLWNTPRATFTNRLYPGNPFISLGPGGLPIRCAPEVCCNFLGSTKKFS